LEGRGGAARGKRNKDKRRTGGKWECGNGGGAGEAKGEGGEREWKGRGRGRAMGRKATGQELSGAEGVERRRGK